jgi:methylenetetrahydrofolate--tRNA-(uracil-5-)-methyltransferase
MSVAWEQSRYDKGETEEERTAYINCPMTKDEYEAFIDALLAAEKTEFKPGETAGYFDGCLPIEVMAERGRETLRHGPMKPVGLTNPHKPGRKRPTPSCSCAATTSSARSTTSSASRPR